MRRLVAILALVIGVGLVASCTGTRNTQNSGTVAAPPAGGSSGPAASCGGGVG